MTARPRFLPALGVSVLAGLVFLLDLVAPMGVAAWVPYVTIVLLSLWFPARWHTYATAGLCVGLMLLDLFFSSPGVIPFWVAAVNRFLGAFAICMVAVVGLAARRTHELEETNRKLEAEIAARERLQAQLLRAQRLESIGVLASGIAHDFNNLLTPILMSVKILQEPRSEDERHRLLATLRASAERGAEMVRQLLAFACGGGGQREIVQPSLIIGEVESILEHTAPKAIRVSLKIAPDLKLIRADTTQLSQVLLNLGINARDAMPSGGQLTIDAQNVTLDADEARIHVDARPGEYVQIAVADTGAGISAAMLDKVFDPFFTSKGPGKGTGLGLSTALGIVRGHGGFMAVESRLGEGSRFSVYLPAVEETLSDGAKAECGKQADGDGKLILVVDDEPAILEMAKATLERCGYRVVTASDGGEAVELCRQRGGEIQAVLLDMMMPGLDGRATMVALAELHPKIKIIRSSGLEEPARGADLRAAERGLFLAKPYTGEQLAATLAKALKHSAGEA